MEENKKIEHEELKKNLLKALAISWAFKAIGKGNHGNHIGFNYCMKNVREFVSEDTWKVLSKTTWHYHDPLETWIVDTKKQIPLEIAWMIGGDSPSIDRLQKMLDLEVD